jgi:hypothetical protein
VGGISALLGDFRSSPCSLVKPTWEQHLNHITVVAHGAPGSLVRTIQESPQIALDLFYAAQEAVKSIPNPLNPARIRLQAAIDLMDLGHIPRRPLPLRLELEAAVVGAQLDGQSLEQGEPA